MKLGPAADGSARRFDAGPRIFGRNSSARVAPRVAPEASQRAPRQSGIRSASGFSLWAGQGSNLGPTDFRIGSARPEARGSPSARASPEGLARSARRSSRLPAGWMRSGNSRPGSSRFRSGVPGTSLAAGDFMSGRFGPVRSTALTPSPLPARSDRSDHAVRVSPTPTSAQRHGVSVDPRPSGHTTRWPPICRRPSATDRSLGDAWGQTPPLDDPNAYVRRSRGTPRRRHPVGPASRSPIWTSCDSPPNYQPVAEPVGEISGEANRVARLL